MYDIHVVPTDKVGIVWPVVKDFIQRSIEESDGLLDVQTSLNLLLQDFWKLLIVIDSNNVVHGVLTIQVVNEVALVTNIAGKGIGNKSMFEKLKNVLKNLGVKEIQGSVRPSIERLWKRLGFTDKYKVVGVKIWE